MKLSVIRYRWRQSAAAGLNPKGCGYPQGYQSGRACLAARTGRTAEGSCLCACHEDEESKNERAYIYLYLSPAREEVAS